jgi:hypothetical protein
MTGQQTTRDDALAAQAFDEQISASIAARKADAIAKRQARRTLRVQLAARRNLGLAARHDAKLAKLTETTKGEAP